jgi:arylsulfatase
MYFTSVHPTGLGLQRMDGIFSASASLSYPTLYNIEMDPHEDIQVAAQFPWVQGFVFKEIDKYKDTLKKYPNPPPPNITKIPAPEFQKL